MDEPGEIGNGGSKSRARRAAGESSRRDPRSAKRALLAGEGRQDSVDYKRVRYAETHADQTDGNHDPGEVVVIEEQRARC